MKKEILKKNYMLFFDRVLDHLIHHHALVDVLDGLDHTTLLKPAKQNQTAYLELLGQKGNIKTIQWAHTTAGHMSEAQLADLLDEKSLANKIVLISNISNSVDVLGTSHCIRLGFKNNKWIVYDPNYSHKDLKTIHREFSTKKEAAAEIISILGNSLGFQLASFTPTQDHSLPAIPAIVKDSTIFAEMGLHIMASIAPHDLSNVIQNLDDKDYESFIQALTKQEVNAGATGLWMIIRYTPSLLPKVFSYIAAHQDWSRITKIITTQDKEKANGLHMIARYAPDCLLQTLMYMSKADDGYNIIAKALRAQDENGSSASYEIARYAPDCLFQALEYMSKADDGNKTIAGVLTTPNKQNWTILHALALKIPSPLLKALPYITQEKEAYVLLKDTIGLQTIDGWTFLNYLIVTDPEQLPELFAFVKQNPILYDAFLKSLKLTTKNSFDPNEVNKNSVELLELSAPNYINELNNLKKYIENHLQEKSNSKNFSLLSSKFKAFIASVGNKNLANENAYTEIARIFSAANKDNGTNLHMIAKYAPSFLLLILDYMGKADDGYNLITKALNVQDDKGCSALKIIERFSPEILAQVSEYISKANSNIKDTNPISAHPRF